MTTEINQRLVEIKERADRATKGDWKPIRNRNGTLIEIQASNGCAVIEAEEYAGACWLNASEADIDFIANARSDISVSLVEIERLADELEQGAVQYQSILASIDNTSAATVNGLQAKIADLTAERDAAWGSLAWAMDEIDALSIKATDGWAYPQGMAMASRVDQLDNYAAACAIRALATSKPE